MGSWNHWQIRWVPGLWPFTVRQWRELGRRRSTWSSTPSNPSNLFQQKCYWGPGSTPSWFRRAKDQKIPTTDQKVAAHGIPGKEEEIGTMEEKEKERAAKGRVERKEKEKEVAGSRANGTVGARRIENEGFFSLFGVPFHIWGWLSGGVRRIWSKQKVINWQQTRLWAPNATWIHVLDTVLMCQVKLMIRHDGFLYHHCKPWLPRHWWLPDSDPWWVTHLLNWVWRD